MSGCCHHVGGREGQGTTSVPLLADRVSDWKLVSKFGLLLWITRPS